MSMFVPSRFVSSLCAGVVSRLLARHASALGCAALLAACGGSSTAPPPPPPPAGTPPPTAAFSAPTSAAPLAPVAFDASASTSGDGSSLVYSWDFGDGRRGGGSTIAHLFSSAGDKTVTLTVADGAGRRATASRTVSVTAPQVAPATVLVEGSVTTAAGTPLDGVALQVVGGNGRGTTDATGKLRLALDVGVPVALRLSKNGYADQIVRLNLPAGAGSDASFAAVMRTRDGAQTLSDAAVGGTLAARDGAQLVLPPNALVTTTGAAVTGPVQATITPVDVTQPAADGFPGSFDGVKANGTTTPIVSFGTVEFTLSANGQPLQLAPGKTATIEIPVYATQQIDGSSVAAGASLPLWSLDEDSGLWVQEGTGTVVASASSPTGLAMRATVSHLSWWNADIGFDPYGPQGDCQADTSIGIPGGANAFATATICNMLAEFDRNQGSNGKATALSAHRAAASTLSPRVVGYSRRVQLPIGGPPVTTPVPAGVNIVLSATALNGTWAGRKVVNGPVGVQAREVILMRPIGTTGPTPEIIAAPFDAVRSLASGQTALFNFVGAASRFARVTVTQSNGSTLAGRMRLLRGTTVLGSGDFAFVGAQVIAQLPANDTYSVEITPTANAPGAYRLQVDLLDNDASETITLPFDGTRFAGANLSSRFRFDGTTPGYVRVTATWSGPGMIGRARLVRGSTELGGAIFTTTPGLFTARLPANDAYVLEVVPAPNVAGEFRLQVERVGSVFTEALAFPFDGSKTIAPLSTYRGTFTIPAATPVWFGASLQGGSATPLRLIGPDGSTLGSLSSLTSANFSSSDALLPASGSYTLELAPEGTNGAQLRLAVEPTPWLQVAPPLSASPASGFLMFEAMGDRNGNPVIGFAQTTALGAGLVQLRRWTGSAWQTMGSDLTFDGPCTSGVSVGMAIDSNNDPIVAYVSSTSDGQTTMVTARRFTGGTWQALGPNNGVLFSGPNFSYCNAAPKIATGPGGAIAIAYRANANILLRRFDGINWVEITSAATDTFADPLRGRTFALGADAGGRLYFVLADGGFTQNTSTVRRLSTTQPPTWEAVGPNNGVLPEVTTVGISEPRLLFDESGHPAIGAIGSIGTLSVSGPGLVTYRFDGTNWATSGGYQPPTTRFANADTLGFAVAGADLYLGWEAVIGDGLLASVVHKRTGSTWVPVGAGLGEIPQFTLRGGANTQNQARQLRPLVIGGQVYLAAAVTGASRSIVLMRKAGD